MPGMPYHLEKGPLLSVIDSFCNTGPVSRLEHALTQLRQGATLVTVGVFDSPNLYSPAFVYPYRNRAELVGHFESHWLGYPPPLNTATAGKQTGHWQLYQGPVEAIMRQTLIRALEVALGVPHGGRDDPVNASRRWTIDFWWKCPQPWFEGWVTWRDDNNGGKVTVIFATPSDDGVVLTHPLSQAKPATNGIAYGSEGSWLISADVHSPALQVTVVPQPHGVIVIPSTFTIDSNTVITVAPNFGSGGAKDGGYPYKGPL